MSLTTRLREGASRLPQPRRSSLGVGALVVAGLSVTQALGYFLPSPTGTGFGEGPQRPFVHEVAVGGQAALRTGDLRVTTVEGADTITAPLGRPVSTDAVFLVVRFDWTPRGERSQISGATLVDARERTYRVSIIGSARDGVWCTLAPPGLTAQCVAALEVPRDALPGARVTLATNTVDDGLDDVAELDLTPVVGPDQAATFGTGRSVSVDSTLRGLS